MDPINFIFAIAILLMSVIAHEVSHGYVAQLLGDPTARLAGRLTLNPLPHLDMMGSLIVPVLTFFLGGFIFGWAKPVPYNPYNMKNPRRDGALVAAAGPLTNIAIAVVFSILIRFAPALGLPASFIEIASIVVFLNILLAFFNLVPVPPLDGSKILFAILPWRLQFIQEFLERYWFVAIFILILFLWRLFLPIIFYVFQLATGLPFA
ncbi:MAG: site-2 protease family protein [Parcubacteria group bacterium]|nr:site-2 protease family protein [Parcubacteria group bacterium]